MPDAPRTTHCPHCDGKAILLHATAPIDPEKKSWYSCVRCGRLGSLRLAMAKVWQWAS